MEYKKKVVYLQCKTIKNKQMKTKTQKLVIYSISSIYIIMGIFILDHVIQNMN